MASKVVWYREAWWVRTRWGGNKKRDRRIGPTRDDKRQAAEIARKINAALVAGTFDPAASESPSLPFDAHLRAWHARHRVTFKPRYVETSLGLVENHLIPFFGSKDLREITREDVLDYIARKLEGGHAPGTILNALTIVRRVLNLAVEDGLITRNPALGVRRRSHLSGRRRWHPQALAGRPLSNPCRR